MRFHIVTDAPNVIGICPACRNSVRDSDSPIWICPYDLSDTNPFRLFHSTVTEYIKKRDSDYSSCPDAHQKTYTGYCLPYHVPLHSRCYNSPSAVW